MHKKRIVFGILASLILIIFAAVEAHAQTATSTPRMRGLRQQTIEDIREKRREKIQPLKGKGIRVIDGEVTAISGSSFKVTKNGKTFTVNTDANTRFRRHFWGKSTLAELSVKDKVNVWGVWADDSQTVINARLVRNLSVMKRHGTFFGEVTSKGTNTFVIKSRARGNQTVTVASDTKIVNRKNESISFADIRVGDKIRVRGVWDKSNSTITEVTHLKDFSLPQRPQTTP